MLIQVNTDNNIRGSQELTEKVETIIRSAIGRFEDRITRIEVHLNDTNGPKSGPQEKRCQIEARLAGLKPLSVSHEGEDLLLAVDAASEKLEHLLDHTLDALSERSRGKSIAREFAETRDSAD